MLLARLAETSLAVAATSSRTAKRDLLAATIGDLEPDEIEPAVGFLIGTPRQGAIGVGWATVARLEVVPAAEPTVTVGDLDQLLTAVAATTGPGSVAARGELLTDFFARATAPEHELVRRILIGDLRQGALEGVVTDAVAKAAGVTQRALRRAVMLQGDLPRTAVVALREGADALAAIQVEVGRPIQPMLASTAADVGEAIDALGEVHVEWKLDGARIQVHRRADRVAIYTRNLNEVTGRLPQVVALVRSFDCTSAVLDGEMLGFFAEEDRTDGDRTEQPSPFQDTMSVFSTDEPSSAAAEALRPFFFDLMVLDDEPLIDRPLVERRRALDRLVGPHAIPAVTTTEATEAGRWLEESLAAGHEGVMVKGLDSLYEAGRRGKAWRKVKPVHTLDLVVLAAEWGHGRRQGWLSNLHLGARDPATGRFEMVGKTFKGMTDELLAWQTERFLALKIDESSTGHTVHVAPELVVEIALDGAQTSTRYRSGLALRFARVKGYRPDRDPATADTLDAVRALL